MTGRIASLDLVKDADTSDLYLSADYIGQTTLEEPMKIR